MDPSLPKLPFRLLRWFCKAELIDEIEGDLYEAFMERSHANRRMATWKLWKEVLLSFNRRNIGIMERLRGNGWFQHWSILGQYAKVLFRTMRRFKVYSTISIVSLMLGITCAGLIYLYIQKELSYDQTYQHYDRIYRVNHKSETSGRSYGFAPMALAPYLEERLEAVEKSVRIFKYRRAIPVTVVATNQSFNEPQFGWADEAFFELFDLNMKKGIRQGILDRPNTVIISETTATKYFGDRDPIGEVLEFSWSESSKLEIVGVYEDFPSNTSFRLDLISNLETCQRLMWSSNLLISWQNMFVSAYLLIKEGTAEHVGAHAQKAVTDNFESQSVWTTSIQPLSDIHLGEAMDVGEWSEHNDVETLMLFGSIGVIILCLGCFNFTNMVTAQAGQRTKEVGVRKVLGSHRKNIAQQTFFETISFVLIAALMSLALMYVMLPKLELLTNHVYGWADIVDSDFIGPFMLLLVVVSVVAGAYPAFYISRIKSLQLMKKFSASDDGRSVRNVLVTAQFSITTGLVICTLIIYQQLDFMHKKKLGYDHSVLINMPIHNDEAIIPRINAFREALTTHSGIAQVTASSHEMLSDYTYITNFQLEGIDEPKLWERYTVEQGYIETFELEMVSGRAFDRTIPSDSSAFILNERAVSALGMQPQEVIGITITDQSLEITGKVIGVVKDFHFRSLHHEIQPFVLYVNWDRLDYLTARLSSENFSKNIEHLEASWYQVFGESVPFFYDFLDQQALVLYRREANEMQLFSIFCLISILLGSLGLFGFILFTTERKFREIGLRKVLGANTAEVILLINKRFINMLFVAFSVAAPVAFALMSNWLSDFAYKIDQPIWVYMLTLAVTFFIATLTVSYSSWKAATSNPVEAIKVE